LETAEPTDAVVIGGGLLGAATAYQLARRGRSVALVDRADAGRATAAGAGILAPQTSASLSGDLLNLSLSALRHYEELQASLAEDGFADTGYAPADVLVVATAEDDQERFARNREVLLDRHAAVVEDVSPAAARDRFPPLAEVTGALLARGCARVDGRMLTAALRAAGRTLGVIERDADARRIEPGKTGVRVLLHNGTELSAAEAVVAAGAWSPELVGELGVALPVEAQRGQIVHLHAAAAVDASWPIVEGLRGHYILPWPTGRVVCGATRETGSGLDPVLTLAGCEEVLREAHRLAPGLAQARIVEWRVGLRPLSTTGRPLVGALPGLPHVHVATGHGPNGLLLGPYCATLLAESLATGRRPAELALLSL
jgi:D-amino-acid dehydrogenase